MTNSSSDVADEEQFFFTQVDNNDESAEQTLEQKERSRQSAKQWATNEESPPWKQVWKKSQRPTETLRHIPWTGLKQMQE